MRTVLAEVLSKETVNFSSGFPKYPEINVVKQHHGKLYTTTPADVATLKRCEGR